MAAEIDVASSSGSFHLGRNPFLGAKPISSVAPIWLFSPSFCKLDTTILRLRRKPSLTVCFVVEGGKSEPQIESLAEDSSEENEKQILSIRAKERRARKNSERFTYLVAAVMSSLGITSMAVLAVYYRFAWQMERDVKFCVTRNDLMEEVQAALLKLM